MRWAYQALSPRWRDLLEIEHELKRKQYGNSLAIRPDCWLEFPIRCGFCELLIKSKTYRCNHGDIPGMAIGRDNELQGNGGSSWVGT
jgi:hypothetical protein